MTDLKIAALAVFVALPIACSRDRRDTETPDMSPASGYEEPVQPAPTQEPMDPAAPDDPSSNELPGSGNPGTGTDPMNDPGTGTDPMNDSGNLQLNTGGTGTGGDGTGGTGTGGNGTGGTSMGGTSMGGTTGTGTPGGMQRRGK